MKKVLKISILLMAAALFFAGCSNSSGGDSGDSSGGGSGGSNNKTFAAPKTNANIDATEVDLSDGVWHIDSYSKQIMTMPAAMAAMGGSTSNEPQVSEMLMHIEMTVNGDDVEVTKATQTVKSNGQVVEEDITNEMKQAYKDKATAEDPSNSGASDSELAQMGITVDASKINPQVTCKKDSNNTEFFATVDVNFKLGDVITIDPSNPNSALFMMMADMTMKQHTDVLYKKQ